MNTDQRAQTAHNTPPRSGILLVNLGTPDAPTPHAVRRYLAEFLSDPRVVDLPRWLWKTVLHGVILRIRPKPVSRAYVSVWTDQGSPLLVESRALTAALRQRVETRYPQRVEVALAMTYGSPSITDTLAQLQAAGVRRLLVLPLYPQYSTTTTAAVFDVLAKALGKQRWLPELRWINDYYRHPRYLDALAATVRKHWEQHGQPQRLLMSFHGIPRRYFEAGDPYYCHCQYTARELAQRLGLKPEEYELAFQSRFGREPWLRPYMDERLDQLVGEGVRHLQIVCPGFAVDCLETLEEVAMRYREQFESAGGETFSYIPALNANDDHAELMFSLMETHMAGWPELSYDYAGEEVKARCDKSSERAARIDAY